MTAYGFKAQFVPPILSGRKRQTIRAERIGPHARIELHAGYWRAGVAYLQAAERELAVTALFDLASAEGEAA